jgi:hypothetical protein
MTPREKALMIGLGLVGLAEIALLFLLRPAGSAVVWWRLAFMPISIGMLILMNRIIRRGSGY